MLKKALLCVGIFLMLANVKASAAALIDADIESVIEGIRLVGSKINVSVWGKEYYTYEGFRRCDLHWGNSKSNLIRFRLGNNNNVQRALVSYPADGSYDNLKTNMEGGLMYGSILAMAGVSQNELDNLGRQFYQDIMSDPYASYFRKIYTVWSSQAQRNIRVDVEFKNERVDFYMYAN